MKVRTRIGWTMWALVPVGLVAFHFGPGERLAARDQAVRLHSHAVGIEERAAFLQGAAHATQLDVIRLRRASFLEDGSDVADDLAEALRVEREAYEVAAEAWQEAADAFSAVEDSLRGNNDPDAVNIRWSKARAQVRAGDIWGGAEEFEILLDELDPKSELSRATREELARAHYFGARLLRVNGEPAEEWRPEVIKARQHFRFLAEQAAHSGASESVIRGLEDNVERALNLEQLDFSEIDGTPFPKESPKFGVGQRPGNKPGEGITRRPPTRRDGRGASGVGEIGRGW